MADPNERKPLLIGSGPPDIESGARMWSSFNDQGDAVSQVELEKRLRKTLIEQRNAEVKLQLELQKKVQNAGTSNKLLKENDMLKKQVEDIRARLLEAKLQNVRLKTELQSRREAVNASLVAKCGRLGKKCMKCIDACRKGLKDQRREAREICCVMLIVSLLGSGMIVFFATYMS